MEIAIEARGLVKTYKGGVRALDGVDLAVPAGTVFGLLGPNGAGKSTVVKIMTTLSRPDSGEATVAGVCIKKNPAQVRRLIGVVAQNSGIDINATGRENLTLQGQIYGMPSQRVKRRSDELLERMGLSDAAKRFARTYSGGMRRKLDVAMGLIHEPEVLFLDEPTTGLDPEARMEMWDELSRLAGTGLTILLTTHYLEEADKLAQSLSIVDRGRVVVEGTPEELKGHLQGDAIMLHLEECPADGAVERILSTVSGTHSVVVKERTVRARTKVAAKALPQAIAELENCGIKVEAVTASRPSLDDVYLHYTGRKFGDVDSEVKR